MPTADEVYALVEAHWKGDQEHFRKTLLCMAANAEAKAPRVAHTLRLLSQRQPKQQVFVQLPQNMQGMLAESRPTTCLADMAIDDATRERVDRILLEQRSRDRLSTHMLQPIRKILLVGPPGVGKTMLAAVLAHELNLPLYRVNLHAVIASHLGETAAHLAQVFQTVRTARAVYLFDEFDALAATRSGGNDNMGEMRRVVNSLLQMIELDESESLIVGTTNLPGIIDAAMWRRFDEILTMPMPTPDVAERLMKMYLGHGEDSDWTRGIDNWDRARTAKLSHADIARTCDQLIKDAIIAERVTHSIYASELERALAARERRCQTSGVTTPDGHEATAGADDGEGSGGDRGGAGAPEQDAGLQLRDQRAEVHHGQRAPQSPGQRL